MGDRGRSSLRKERPDHVSFAESLSFDDLVIAVEPELRRFVARKVPLQEVDDVLQEIWIAAWQALPGFDRKSKLRTWLYGICLHKCHDRYRAQKSAARFVSLEEAPLVDDRSMESDVLRSDTVNRLLAGLDENSREILELYYYAQLTLAEIATIVDRNLNTVKYQFYRAHAAMLDASQKEALR